MQELDGLDWLMVANNSVCVLVSLLLTFFSLQALRVMRAKGVERTLWKPVLASSAFFLIGSFFSLSYELGEKSIETFDALHHVVWLIGLVILVYGVFTYLAMLKKIGSAKS